MLVDPRPFTYEYRKPRFLNPTLYPFIYSVNHATSTKVSTTATLNNPTTTFLKEFPYATTLTHACPGSTSTTKNPLITSLSPRIKSQPMSCPNLHKRIGTPKGTKAIDFPPSTRLLYADNPNWAAIWRICRVVFLATT